MLYESSRRILKICETKCFDIIKGVPIKKGIEIFRDKSNNIILFIILKTFKY